MFSYNHLWKRTWESYCFFWLNLMLAFYHYRGGFGEDESGAGENGTVTGKACPKGLYGIFCEVGFLFKVL